MFGLGIPEIILILLAVGILFFGSKKILELSRSMGRVSGEFKKGRSDIEKEIKEGMSEGESNRGQSGQSGTQNQNQNQQGQ